MKRMIKSKFYAGTTSLLLCGALLIGSVSATNHTAIVSRLDAHRAGTANILQAPVGASNSRTLSLDLSIPQTFQITRPTKQITTTYKNYFITGTSNPNLPVYFNGEAIERIGTMGTFGVHVPLEIGTNTFTFRQGEKQQTVTIVRRAETTTGVVPISAITQNSMFPSVHAGVKVGENLKVSCIGPAGAKITASFGGVTVQLTQVAAAQSGVPATFSGEIAVNGNYDSDITQKVGPVTYTMTYGGSSKSYKSLGDVYVAGKNTYISARVTSYLGFVYPNTSNLSVFKELIKTGGIDFVKSQNNSYVNFYSGGSVPIAQTEIVTGTSNVSNRLSSASLNVGAKSETFTFAGTNKPFYDAVLTNTTFSFRMYNTSGIPAPSVANSKLFSSVSVVNENKATTYTFTFKNRSNYWGYSVNYGENGNIILELKHKPKLSSSSTKPFEGLVVLIDPGHGGTDPGALGLPGTTGPTESTLNLAHSYAIRDKLTSMGATVYLTRDNDTFYTLDDRLLGIEQTRADIFLSVHHNSVVESANANTINGVEVYYHNMTSATMANNILQSLSTNTGRRARVSSQSYYRVTLLQQSPALLLELGFMSNPAEYEASTTQAMINRVANSVAEGIRKSLM